MRARYMVVANTIHYDSCELPLVVCMVGPYQGLTEGSTEGIYYQPYSIPLGLLMVVLQGPSPHKQVVLAQTQFPFWKPRVLVVLVLLLMVKILHDLYATPPRNYIEFW